MFSRLHKLQIVYCFFGEYKLYKNNFFYLFQIVSYMFSIIVPLYNKAAYVEKSIRSILNQTFLNYEIIVIDDGSTDNSLTELRIVIDDLRILNEKIKIVEQENQGVSATRNNGVALAKYDYIAFLDADDWWAPNYLEEMSRLISTYPDAGIYGSSYYKVKNNANIPAKIGVDSGFIDGYIDYFKVFAKTMYMPLWTGATIVKRRVFCSVNGFNPKLKGGEDFELWVRVVQKYKVALLNKPLSYYNQDVELCNRAVRSKLHEPSEHVIFFNFGNLNNYPDFRKLFEILAVYSLMSYYLVGKNKLEVDIILRTIHWENHPFKYRLYYKILPKFAVRWWLVLLEYGSKVKRTLSDFRMTNDDLRMSIYDFCVSNIDKWRGKFKD